MVIVTIKMRESFSDEREKGVLQAEVLHVQPEGGACSRVKGEWTRCCCWVGKGNVREALRSVFIFCAM